MIIDSRADTASPPGLGIDIQLISPRPFQTMHSEKPGYLLDWYIHEVNKVNHYSAKMFPDKIVPIIQGFDRLRVSSAGNRGIAK